MQARLFSDWFKTLGFLNTWCTTQWFSNRFLLASKVFRIASDRKLSFDSVLEKIRSFSDTQKKAIRNIVVSQKLADLIEVKSWCRKFVYKAPMFASLVCNMT